MCALTFIAVSHFPDLTELPGMETIRQPVECPNGVERRSIEDRRGSETRPLAPYGAEVVVEFAVRDPVGEQSAEVRRLSETVAVAADGVEDVLLGLSGDRQPRRCQRDPPAPRPLRRDVAQRRESWTIPTAAHRPRG
jgi:hypothetical protein